MIRLGTRGSALALAQARLVADRLPDARARPITTAGDRGSRDDKSRFVKELESALLAGEIDLAVHSAKDVPGRAARPAWRSSAVPERADPRDALCGAALARRARRRARASAPPACAGARSCWPCAPTSRSASCAATWTHGCAGWPRSDFDAIVLAQAGLDRLGRADEGAPLAELVPAPGQGCLRPRGTRGRCRARPPALTDASALAALTAERALVVALEATCHTPIGAHAVARDGALGLRAFVGLPDGSHWIRDELEGVPDDPLGLGLAAAERLRSAGAAELLADAERMAVAG